MIRTMPAAAAGVAALLLAAPPAGLAQDAAPTADAAKLEALGNAVRTLTAEAGAQRGEVEVLRAELTERESAAEAARKEIAARDAKVQALSAEIAAANALKPELATARAEAAEMAEAQHALTEQAESVAATAAALEVRLAEAEAALDRQRAELLAARNDLGSAEGRLVGKEKEVAALAAVGRELVAGGEQLAASNLALERQVESLAGPSEMFFARLQETLGPESGVRIENDRLVFPADVAFVSGSARLTSAARAKAAELGRQIADATAAIPPGTDWILRVDGHTDRQRIGSGMFASNRELSAARALEVAELLTEAGVPPEHLAPAAFGEFRPLDRADTPEAYRANRRIELRLDEG